MPDADAPSPPRPPLALEIAVASSAGARIAAEHGADRVELCTALEIGGVTPSAALVDAAVAEALPVHVLVRCRGGDFAYDDDEVAVMRADVVRALHAGARGVVVGALDAHGGLDERVVRTLVDAARGARAEAEVTLHRAVDLAADPVATAARAAALGVDRILTSGGAASAAEGLPTLARMVAAAGPVQIMAGGGVRVADLAAIAGAGAVAAHLSAKRVVRAVPGAVALGVADDATHLATDPALVAEAREAVDAVERERA